MSQDTKYKIQIVINTKFNEELSGDGYFFHYIITIINKSQNTVRLKRRHWYICELLQDIREVEGEGVVGETPILNPNESYTYTSAVILYSPIGFMYGYYTLENLHNKSLFQVEINQFELVHPSLLN